LEHWKWWVTEVELSLHLALPTPVQDVEVLLMLNQMSVSFTTKCRSNAPILGLLMHLFLPRQRTLIVTVR